LLNSLDHFSSESSQLVSRRRFVVSGRCQSDFFEEDGDSLDWFVAQRSLGCGKLEGVADLVGEVASL
jgi:hypothetical protein